MTDVHPLDTVSMRFVELEEAGVTDRTFTVTCERLDDRLAIVPAFHATTVPGVIRFTGRFTVVSLATGLQFGPADGACIECTRHAIRGLQDAAVDPGAEDSWTDEQGAAVDDILDELDRCEAIDAEG